MKATALIRKNVIISEIDRRIYGSFIEHMGRAIYSGIYEPAHVFANEHGFRCDVLDLVKELAIPIVRYPGGNFVSAYDWQDGIGPQVLRPTRLDLAWHSSESNQVGIHEFADWAEQAGCEMMLAVNLGSRGLSEARDFLEYVNHPQGTYWSDLRIKNGQLLPWGVKTWCLGNEMDGPWQIGQKSAQEYGRLAFETAKAMRAFDNSLQLVVCGSSGPDMPTCPAWEMTVLEHTYEMVDYLSLHMYFEKNSESSESYLAQSIKLERYIESVIATIDHVKFKKGSKKQVNISFDEWNVWYHSKQQDSDTIEGRNGWPFAPAILEDIYNVEDALQVACTLNCFIRKSDRVKIACIAQLVNVIAPIMTEKDGSAWRQTIFYPLLFASLYGRGYALQVELSCPTYDASCAEQVPYIDISAVYDQALNSIAIFIVNRHSQNSIELSTRFEQFQQLSLSQHQVIQSDDVQLTNSASHPEAVIPKQGEGVVIEDQLLCVNVAALSYHFIQLKGS